MMRNAMVPGGELSWLSKAIEKRKIAAAGKPNSY
jgi:hypothetical protein